MQLRNFLSVLEAFGGISTPVLQPSRLNDTGSSDGLHAECATYATLLCYPNICDTSEFADPTINIFVKRFLAPNVTPSSQQIYGLFKEVPDIHWRGNRHAGTAPDSERRANVYTMDHGGTGRSTRLDCVAAQATRTGSPLGDGIAISEVSERTNAPENEYGDLALFSMTSAATDLSAFISDYSNGASTIVYGATYGAAVVERLIHLALPTVTGYVMDSISTSSGAYLKFFEYMSTSDTDFGEVSDKVF
ncbi:hypothetical protein F441_16432 [Phytophthora nicotianae CJ01A1]|uniref:Uncharacterized protein n=2 Tax=Phytophthora nicotianae TaxID=4792 RepID=W2WB77_PHYNI|nr:hypothetical protein F441_16432 [Phytophthora nicotianae CJ01A1]